MPSDEKRARKRASKLRRDERLGRKLNAKERAHLEAWPKLRVGRKPEPVEREGEGDQADLPLETETSAPPIAPEFEVAAETPAPDAPRVTPRDAGTKSTGKDWRAKYRSGQAAGEREATCVQLASLWKHALKKMNAAIIAGGASPAIPDDVVDGALGNCIVLTVDKLMPTDFNVGPEVEAAVASSVITGQAWWVSRAAKKRGDAVASKAARHAAQYVNPDAAKPDPSDEQPRALTVVRAPPMPKVDESTVF